jgi:hypothetical protein
VARKYRYTDVKTNRIIFETTQPNYISMNAVDLMCLKKTKRDPRLERGRIDREIRVEN